MALTTELLNANAALAGLTDEQRNAIVAMSRNDEAAVIGQKTGEIYGGLDADILGASGIAKEGAEKTYEYAKRVIGALKGQAGNAADLQEQLTKALNEKTRLEGVIAKGGADAETKRQFDQMKADLANVTKQYTDLRGEYDKAKADYAKEMFNTKIDGEFAKATAGVKFKADLPATVTKVLLTQAVEKVKAMNPEYIDDGNGGKVLAFMENGTPKRNPANNLCPFTAAELVEAELKAMGVLEDGRKQTGAGVDPNTTTTQTGGGIDISGARTQDEAHELIAKALMGAGKVNGSKEFNEAMQKAWKDNYSVIKTLPVR